MVWRGVFSQRVRDGNGRSSEQKPLIPFFLVAERVQGDWYVSPSSKMALRAWSDTTQTSPVMFVHGEKQMLSDVSPRNTTQVQELQNEHFVEKQDVSWYEITERIDTFHPGVLK